jgi:hypothetical protein
LGEFQGLLAIALLLDGFGDLVPAVFPFFYVAAAGADVGGDDGERGQPESAGG